MNVPLSCHVCNIFLFLSCCRLVYAVVTELTGHGADTWAETDCCKPVLCTPEHCWRQKQLIWRITTMSVVQLLLCYIGYVVEIEANIISWLNFAESLFHMICFLSALSLLLLWLKLCVKFLPAFQRLETVVSIYITQTILYCPETWTNFRQILRTTPHFQLKLSTYKAAILLHVYLYL